MTVWIDICHIPQYNFYRNLILKLAAEGNKVLVTVLDRGKTPKIIRHELGGVEGVESFVVGKHRMKKWSAVLEANCLRILKLLWWARNKHINIALSNCMAAMVIGWLLRIPRYSFDDDPQTMDFLPKKWCSLESNYCLYEDAKTAQVGGTVQVLRCLKEWAYLAPNVFVPNPRALDKYGVRPKEYLFLREVSVGTVNYVGQKRGAILHVKDLIPKDKKVLFSLEEKHRRDEYPADWILLQEPIEDIHSLIYYSAGLASSGDSMAREAAMLGVPAYYLGIRHTMPANRAAAQVAGLQNEETMSFLDWTKTLNVTPAEAEQRQRTLREQISHDFIDINAYMLALVHNTPSAH